MSEILNEVPEANATFADPELSIVMSCLNETRTVSTCETQALAYVERHNIVGEVIVADDGRRLPSDCHLPRRSGGGSYLTKRWERAARGHRSRARQVRNHWRPNHNSDFSALKYFHYTLAGDRYCGEASQENSAC
jgi:hypothetical protein